MAKLIILEGTKFKMLTYLKDSEPLVLPCGQKNRVALCKCDCGNEKEIRLLHLVRGRIKSCGCIFEGKGMAGTRIYNCWRSMKYRCKDNYFQSQYYSKRGITLHKSWESFLNFKTWAYNNGFKDNLQIDRIDNNKGYYPDNCRFVSQIENLSNRNNTYIVSYKNKKIPFTILLREKKLINHYAAIFHRIKRGYSIDRAIDTPIKKGNYANKKTIKI